MLLSSHLISCRTIRSRLLHAIFSALPYPLRLSHSASHSILWLPTGPVCRVRGQSNTDKLSRFCQQVQSAPQLFQRLSAGSHLSAGPFTFVHSQSSSKWAERPLANLPNDALRTNDDIWLLEKKLDVYVDIMQLYILLRPLKTTFRCYSPTRFSADGVGTPRVVAPVLLCFSTIAKLSSLATGHYRRGHRRIGAFDTMYCRWV